MYNITPELKLFLNLTKIQTVNARRFTGGLEGLGFSEFAILLHLSQAPDEKLRRIDLAEKVGLTASGVTRLLAPMEKLGLIEKEQNAKDARVSYVKLRRSGKRNMTESLASANRLAQDIFPTDRMKKLEGLSEVLIDLGGSVK
jgi:DNA-binding MarR family transcriptional regulator